MKVSGCSFIKDAILYDYPILEAIQSILPLCDEFIITVGASSDKTMELIQSIEHPKIKIIPTIWDESLRKGGKVLAVETDKALQHVSPDSDWIFYIQGDEVVHESDWDTIRKGMQHHLENTRVDGLLFQYHHFFGSYDYVGISSNWYPHEIRIIRNDKTIYSYGDAQGFRKGTDEKLNVVPIPAHIYHYGWVKDPRTMQKKRENFSKYWYDDEWIEKNMVPIDAFDYGSVVHKMDKFKGTHPLVMKDRIQQKNWQFESDLSFERTPIKEKAKSFLKHYLGMDFSYKNYKIIKP